MVNFAFLGMVLVRPFIIIAVVAMFTFMPTILSDKKIKKKRRSDSCVMW